MLLLYGISVLRYFGPTQHRTYNDSCRSDVHLILLIRPTQEFCRYIQSVFYIDNVIIHMFIKLNLHAISFVHPTYTYKVVHPTYTYVVQDPTYLIELCNVPKNQQLCKSATDQQYMVRYTNFLNEVCIRPTVHRTSFKLLKNNVREGPKYRRTDVTLGGCNTIEFKYRDLAPTFLVRKFCGKAQKIRSQLFCHLTKKQFFSLLKNFTVNNKKARYFLQIYLSVIID